MATNPVCWFEIYVQDMNRARKFYEKVLKVKLTKLVNPMLEMWSFPNNMTDFGSGGALAKMEGVSSGGCGTVVYFTCKDCAVEEKRIVSAGGKIHRSKFSIGEYGFIALATDTEGNMFGLHSLK